MNNEFEINNFDDLTSFMNAQYAKMSEVYGLVKPSQDYLEFVESTLVKYSKLYDKPLERKIKRQIALMEAIDTMPHGWLWKLFHWDLWQIIKKIPEFAPEIKPCKKEEHSCSEPEVLTPTVIKQTTYPEVQD